MSTQFAFSINCTVHYVHNAIDNTSANNVEAEGKWQKKESIEKIDDSHLLLKNAFSTNSNLSWVLLMVDSLKFEHEHDPSIWRHRMATWSRTVSPDWWSSTLCSIHAMNRAFRANHWPQRSNRIMPLTSLQYTFICYYAIRIHTDTRCDYSYCEHRHNTQRWFLHHCYTILLMRRHAAGWKSKTKQWLGQHFTKFLSLVIIFCLISFPAF